MPIFLEENFFSPLVFTKWCFFVPKIFFLHIWRQWTGSVNPDKLNTNISISENYLNFLFFLPSFLLRQTSVLWWWPWPWTRWPWSRSAWSRAFTTQRPWPFHLGRLGDGNGRFDRSCCDVWVIKMILYFTGLEFFKPCFIWNFWGQVVVFTCNHGNKWCNNSIILYCIFQQYDKLNWISNCRVSWETDKVGIWWYLKND